MNASESYTEDLRDLILDAFAYAGNSKKTSEEQAEKVGELANFILDNEELTADELKDVYNKFADIVDCFHLMGANEEDDKELEWLSSVNEENNRYYDDTCYVSYAYGEGEERWYESDSPYEIYSESYGEDTDLQRIKLAIEKFEK